MRVGVLLLPADPWPEAAARVQHLEALGYDHIWTFDHLSWRRYRDKPWFGSTPWLAGVAALTERIRFGTLVTSPTFRHPVPYAKEVVTLDQMSNGRFTLGIGAGATGFDATALGTGVLESRPRFDRYVEFVDLLDRLLREPTASYTGEYYNAHEVRREPPCVQQPRVPFVLAGNGPRGLALVARAGDAWVTHAGGYDGVARRTVQLNEACAAAGRDPATLDRVLLVENEAERPLAGVAAFHDFIERYGALGFTDVVLPYPRPGDEFFTDDKSVLEEIATELPSSG